MLALGAWAVWLEPASLTTDEVMLPGPWRSRRPLRVAVLTDLHVGSPFNGVTKLRAVVDRSNAASPDIVYLPGDLVIQGVVGGRFVPGRRSCPPSLASVSRPVTSWKAGVTSTSRPASAPAFFRCGFWCRRP